MLNNMYNYLIHMEQRCTCTNILVLEVNNYIVTVHTLLEVINYGPLVGIVLLNK